MSLHFDMVINCDLNEDVPADAVEAIKFLTQPDYSLEKEPQLIYTDTKYPGVGNMWETIGFGGERFLMPDPDHDIISNFRRVHRYRLQYCGSWLHDDYFYQYHLPFVYWLATVAYENYIGYYMETHGTGLGVHHLQVEDGLLVSR